MSTEPDNPTDSVKEPESNGLLRDAKGRWANGNSGGPGRTPGVPNKNTGKLIDDILQAYESKGGTKFLRALGDVLFVKLLERLIPKQIEGKLGLTLDGVLGLGLSEMSPEQLARLAHASGEGSPDSPGEETK